MDSVFLFYQPLPETVSLVEDIVVEYVTDLVKHSFGLLTVYFFA